ncbi:hypothetical protein MPSEU_000668800 [Mayamaea pseudoterrestris]|nr:hypothetical protein MPSEU_000668800 [Mayamaea pseudoterrestris]
MNVCFTMVWMTAAASMGVRLSNAFSPMRLQSRRFAASSSQSASNSRRRKRNPYSGDSGIALMEELKQQRPGLFKDNYHGGFMLQSSVTSSANVAESDTSINVNGDSQPNDSSEADNSYKLVFPLQGKINTGDLPPRMRFAPSPTGSLHVGGARTALYNWLVAKKGQLEQRNVYSGGAAFLLRVEDTDVARSTKESEESVLADLRWLGLHWDEGPNMENAPYGPYRQSERAPVYFAAADQLLNENKAYKCFCTNEELEQMKVEQEARGEVCRYDGRWRDASPESVQAMLDQGKPYTIRFKVPENSRIVIDDIVRGTVSWDAQATVGDFILLRSSGVPVYNFCVAVDDASMGVTTVVRAEEHLTNTVRQALILDALAAPRPRYAHCSLILGEDKQKLSKRHGATSCDQYRLDGFLPDAMINYLALLGWNDGTDNEIFTREELIDAFDLNRVVKSPSVFDVEKLKWVNGQHIKMTSVEDLIPRVREQMQWENLFQSSADMESRQVYELVYAATSLAKQRMETLKDAAKNAKEVLTYGLPATFEDLVDGDAKRLVQDGNFYALAMRLIAQVEAGDFPVPDASNPLAAFQDASGQAIEEDSQKGALCEYTGRYLSHMKALAKEMKLKGKHFFHPVRLAMTGEMSGQDVTKQLSFLALASREGCPLNVESIGMVTFDDRIARLKAFCDTIPEEYRHERSAAEVDKLKANNDMKQSAASSSGGTTTSLSSANGAASMSASTADPKDSYDGPPISALDIRVGRINKVWEHEEAEKLYCEEIDVGEGEPRMIASGLRPYLAKEDMEGRLVLVLCNLKERKLVGFPSHGMVLCASNADHTSVRLVSPPIDAKIGERVTVPDFDFESEEGAPFAENKIGKKKVFEALAPHLVTNKYGVPEFLGRPFMTSAGVCTSPISDGSVS